MLNLARVTSFQAVDSVFCEAIIQRHEKKENKVLLKFIHSRNYKTTWAKIALATGTIEEGAKVLAVGDACNGFYVIGLLDMDQHRRKNAYLEFKNGTYITIDEQNGNEQLCVRAPDNTMELTYDPLDKKLTISNCGGDVEFIASGDIVFKSERSVQLQGDQINLMSQSAGTGHDIASSRLSINPKRTAISTQQLDLTSLASNIVLKRVRFNTNELIATAKKMKLIVERCERIAVLVIEKAKNVFQTVEELAQLKAKRLKTRVKETYYIKSKRAFVKTEEDYKIKSDKIHLG